MFRHAIQNIPTAGEDASRGKDAHGGDLLGSEENPDYLPLLGYLLVE
jgi:hypothetical protein